MKVTTILRGSELEKQDLIKGAKNIVTMSKELIELIREALTEK